MRARDPYYPTLMREEFQRLAISVDANAEEAEHLVTRYLCALEDIERHLVKLCTESSLPRIKDLIAFRLKSFYHRIKWDTFDRQKEFRKKAPMYSDLRSASKERFHVTQQDGWTKRKTLEQQTRELAAQVTGKKESTKRPTPAVKEWVHDKMWTLLELEHELVVFRNTLELDESHFAKEPSEEATKFAKQFPIHEWNWPGVSFPDFWKQWLDAYLRKCWITSPPEGKKAQASIYRKSSAELAASAAEFWICNLWDWEPRNCETASTEVCMASCDAARESPQQSSSVNPWLIARQ
ncbi:MAG: hypothetical protein JNJ83_00815 [Verrucomicrobiaceae bacterium]|nr:hypothetical protein [Verrucomicrobiaceae bacterium]